MPLYDHRVMLAEYTRTYATAGDGTRTYSTNLTRWQPMWAKASELGITGSVDDVTGDLLDVAERAFTLRYLDPSDYPNLAAGGSTARTEDGPVTHYTVVFDYLGRGWDVVGIADGDVRRRETVLTCRRVTPYARHDADVDPATFPASY